MPSLACYKFWTPPGNFQINLIEILCVNLDSNLSRNRTKTTYDCNLPVVYSDRCDEILILIYNASKIFVIFSLLLTY